MTQQATVIQIIDAQNVRVRIHRTTSCGHDCSSCGGCGITAAPVEVEVKNSVGAELFDLVTVESKTSQVIGLATMVYLIPIVLLFGLYAIAAAFSAQESVRALVGVIGLVLGLILCQLMNRRGTVDVEITGIVRRGSGSCSDM